MTMSYKLKAQLQTVSIDRGYATRTLQKNAHHQAVKLTLNSKIPDIFLCEKG